MTRGRLRAAGLVAWLLLCAVGCETRTGDEMDWGPISTPPWTIGGVRAVQRGASEAEVVGRLGAGKHKGSYRPGGSGVISCSMQRIGGDHAYEDATTRYTVSIYEDRLASGRARPRPFPHADRFLSGWGRLPSAAPDPT